MFPFSHEREDNCTDCSMHGNACNVCKTLLQRYIGVGFSLGTSCFTLKSNPSLISGLLAFPQASPACLSSLILICFQLLAIILVCVFIVCLSPFFGAEVFCPLVHSNLWSRLGLYTGAFLIYCIKVYYLSF